MLEFYLKFMPSSFGEMLLKKYLKLRYPNSSFFYNKTFPWLINPNTGKNLEFDIYCPQLTASSSRATAWEFQGGQHYKNEKQIERDEIKKKLARKHGVTLKAITLLGLYQEVKKASNNGKNDKYKSIFKSITTYKKKLANKYNDISAKRKNPSTKRK